MRYYDRIERRIREHFRRVVADLCRRRVPPQATCVFPAYRQSSAYEVRRSQSFQDTRAGGLEITNAHHTDTRKKAGAAIL